jgi:hypothetical protein
MSSEETILVPSFPYVEADEKGVFSKFEPGTRVLPAGFRTLPEHRPIPVDIVFEKDVAVTLRDGTTIYVDVLRPTGTEKVPVLVAWSPYGKSTGTDPKYAQLFGLLGIDIGVLSGLAKFEGPDPAFWCANGYAVCNPDPRGVFNSEGDSILFGEQEGRDCHDLIEWLGVQDWCNGKVAMSGTSYLTISQWYTAAEQPPHLAAIAPCEGMSDIYRDLTIRGGIPDHPFSERLTTSFVGANRREDIIAEAERYPLMNGLWQSKSARLEKIDVPAYIVASYSNSIHTPGTFRGWRRISSADKWLRIHNTMEWPDYYDEANVQDLRRFFDRYLKDADNGWEQTPRVRYSVLDLEGGDRVGVPATSFPPADVSYVRYHLDGESRALGEQPPNRPAVAAYDAESEREGVSFTVRFPVETEVVGYPKVRLWVEADGSDDMDLFVLLLKLNAEGEPLEQFNVPNHGPVMDSLTRDGASILKYKGSNGRLRVSLRHLDEVWSTDAVPAHSFDRVEKLAPGEIVPVEIDMFPVGLALHPGEQLRLVVSGENLWGGVMPGTASVVPDNHGRHVIHTGGTHASYLQLPVRTVG